MLRLLNFVSIVFMFVLILLLDYKTCITERVSYISTEHPEVTYYNKKFVEYANVSARRFGRQSRFYYVDMFLTILITFNNSMKWDFIFHEYLSNTYRRTFVEMHFGTCDLILKDKFFGTALKRSLKTCPVLPGTYHMWNMSIPLEHIPAGFPFTKGRIYANCTFIPTKELAFSGYIDMEIKEYTVKKQKVGNKKDV